MTRPPLTRGTRPFLGAAQPRRPIAEAEVMDGARHSTLDELAVPTVAADKVLVFQL